MSDNKMSCSYAEGLSEYHDKGKLGLPEKFDVNSDIIGKVVDSPRYKVTTHNAR